MIESFIWMTVGLLVGGTAGVLVMALCFMARDRGDE
jgi:hypothetical protein